MDADTLAEIKVFAGHNYSWPGLGTYEARYRRDVPALVAEVERLQESRTPPSSIEDRLGDVYDAAGAYLTACAAIDQADAAGMLEAIVRRDAAFAELRAARYPEETP